MLKKGKATRTKNALYVMETTVDRLSRLVNGLLDAAQLRFVKDDERGRVDVHPLLEEIYEDCRLLAKDKSVEFSFASRECRVAGNRDKLKEVLLNLVSNAVKHTSPGGSVALTARGMDDEVELAVADTGSGIATRDLPHIFDRFYHISEPVPAGTQFWRFADMSPRGNGLGLHISRQIIKAHGGTIAVESKVGEGSRFVVRLPLVE